MNRKITVCVLWFLCAWAGAMGAPVQESPGQDDQIPLPSESNRFTHPDLTLELLHPGTGAGRLISGFEQGKQSLAFWTTRKAAASNPSAAIPAETLLYQSAPFAAPSELTLAFLYARDLDPVGLWIVREDTVPDRLMLLPYRSSFRFLAETNTWHLPKSWQGVPVTLKIETVEPVEADNWISFTDPAIPLPERASLSLLDRLRPVTDSLQILLMLAWMLAPGVAILLCIKTPDAPFRFLSAWSLTLLLCYGMFFAFVVHRGLGIVLNLTLVFVSIVILWTHFSHLKTGFLRDRDFQSSCALWLFAALLSQHAGFLLGGDGFAAEIAATRYRFPALPADHVLPYRLALRVLEQMPFSPFFEDWNASDRPPIQSALLLFARPILFSPEQSSCMLGLVAQCSIIPMAFGMLRVWKIRLIPACLMAMTLAWSGNFLINSLFAWPKLIAASLLFGIVAIWTRDTLPNVPGASPRLRKGNFDGYACGVLAALSMLNHGSSLIALIPIFFVLWLRQPITHFAIVWRAAVAFLPIMLPWILFQRYVDPPGDRLLKWHLAGFPELTDEPFLTLLVNQYRSLDWQTWLQYKWSNVKTILGDWRLMVAYFYPYQVFFDFRLLRTATFANFAAGLFPLVAAVLPRLLYLRSRRKDSTTTPVHSLPLLAMTGVVFCGLLVWVLLIYLPSETHLHQGSYFLLFLAMLVLLLVPLHNHPRWLAVVLLFNLLYLWFVWLLPPFFSYYQGEWLVSRPPFDGLRCTFLAALSILYLWVIVKGLIKPHLRD